MSDLIKIEDILTTDLKNKVVDMKNKSIIGLLKKSDNIVVELELLKATAIQDYLLSRGGNDEAINDRVRELKSLINQ